MYAALLNKKLVLAIEEAYLVYQGEKRLNANYYYCPKCNKKVILVISQYKSPFFKHVSIITGEGEKQEHLESKKLLCSALVASGYKAKMEVSLASSQLRADILASEKLAFEIQCAPLSNEEFNHRHKLYQQLKIKDIWVVGKRHYLKNKLSKSQEKYLRKSQNWGWYLLEVEPTKQLLHLKYFIQLEANSSKVWYRRRNFKLDENGLKELFNFVPLQSPIKYIEIRRGKNYLRRQLREKTKLGKIVGSLLYEKNLTIEQIPARVLTKNREPFDSMRIIEFLQQKKTSQ